MLSIFKHRDSDAPRDAPTRASRCWYHWHDPAASRVEKMLVWKLDFFILLYTCLTFFVKYLDQTNITNAYVSGMKEDLHLNGDQLNWLTTYFNIGIIIGAPISTSILTRVPPRYWLPFCTMIWSLFVLFMYKAQNIETLYGLRFSAGLFESGAYPGAFFIIGSWYKKSEISRRSGIYIFSSVVGQMCSGYIQAGLLSSMNGRLGLAAWRWLFILDFLISLPVAVFGFFCCPDQPKSKRMWWMNEVEQEMAIERLKIEGRDAQGKWNLKNVVRFLGSWQLWAFTVAWGLVELTCGNQIQRWMALWLKSIKIDGHQRYSDQQVNILPTVVGVVELVWIFLATTAADAFNNKALPMLCLGLVQLFCYIVFLVRTSDRTLRFAAYYLASAYGGLSPLLGGWINSACGGDTQLRAFSTAFMISVGYAVETPVQQIVFPTEDAPDFRKTKGYVYGVTMVVVMIVWCAFALPSLEIRFGRKKEVVDDEASEVLHASSVEAAVPPKNVSVDAKARR